MSEYADTDREHMSRALQIAARGQCTAHPNPMVGCVIVNDGVVVGEGWHAVAGEPHAEVHALQAAGGRASGARVYVTLEPCAHHGKTPPCADALIQAGVAEVLIAMTDPNPKVAGLGSDALRAAGVAVRIGLLAESAAELNRGFSKRMTRGRPHVMLKIAASLDGRTAMKSGESQWITGAEARADVQVLRAASGAILTGIGTVIADDPSLTVRDESAPVGLRQPLRAVLDSDLNLPADARMLSLPGRTRVYTSSADVPESLGTAELVRVPRGSSGVDLGAVLDDLGSQEINTVLVEAGATLSGALLAANLVDELVIYQAPHIMGSETHGMFRTPGWTRLSDRRDVDITDIVSVGADTRITAMIRN
jgi:diaminohydroxyphosphoribosylaminopyrimidine deaminase/5-amino-6-(5-phosphoribosylamino)uracil reductase